jgi:hypothetical protein
VKKITVLLSAFILFNTAEAIQFIPENASIKKVPVAKIEEFLKEIETNAETKKYAHAVKFLRDRVKQLKENKIIMDFGGKQLHEYIERKIKNKEQKVIGYGMQAGEHLKMLFPATPQQRKDAETNRKFWEQLIDGIWGAKFKNTFACLQESSDDIYEKEQAQKKTGKEDPGVVRHKALCIIDDLNSKSVLASKKLTLLQEAYLIHTCLVDRINKYKIAMN